jgi:L-gulono-1,4-lactone dehydrogenase
VPRDDSAPSARAGRATPARRARAPQKAHARVVRCGRLLRAAFAMTTFANYGKNWAFTPSRVHYPASAAELQRLVRGATKLRVMGARHSWSKGIVTDQTLVSLDGMNRILHVDVAAKRVTVQAGIRLKDLIAGLDARGLALSNLGSIHEQSLAGAISTGTHGSGLGFRCLADQVERLKLIDGNGDERTLGREDADFDAAVVGLGCLGVVHEVTLAVVPAFQMHAVTDTMPWSELLASLDTLVRGHDHFKFWWLVPEDRVVVFRNDRTTAPRNDSDLQRWLRDELLSVAVYRVLVALGKRSRARLIPPINRFLTGEVGKRFERVCKSYVGFLTPVPPIHRETEWAFDYEGAGALLTKYREHLLTSGHTYNFVQEIRFTKADPFWLSPAYRRDSIWLSMYNMDSDARWNAQVAAFEAFARANGGRPHWGKEATFDPAYLRGQLEKLDAFAALMRAYDPQRKLVNDWVASIFGAAEPEG